MAPPEQPDPPRPARAPDSGIKRRREDVEPQHLVEENAVDERALEAHGGNNCIHTRVLD